MAVRFVEPLASTWQPPHVQKPWYSQALQAVVGLRADRGRAGERVPAEPPRRVRHELGEARPPERRQRILTVARALEDVPARIDHPAQVPRLARDAVQELDLVVVGLELLVVDRPVGERRAGRKRPGAVPPNRLAALVEVPRHQAPALARPVNRRPADAVHHAPGRDRGHRSLRGRPPLRRYLVVDLRPAEPVADVVANLVRVEVPHGEAAAGLEADDLEPCPGERQHCCPTTGPEADDDDVGFLRPSAHHGLPSVRP